MKELHLEDQKRLDFASAQALIQITEKIIQRHQQMGPASPLNPGQIADVNYKISFAKAKHEEGMKYQRLMENAWLERDHFLGSANEGFGALSAVIQSLCNLLLDTYKTDHKELEKWF